MADYSNNYTAILKFTIDEQDTISYDSNICIFDKIKFYTYTPNEYFQEFDWNNKNSKITYIYTYKKTNISNCLCSDDYYEYNTLTEKCFIIVTQNGHVYIFDEYDTTRQKISYTEFDVPIICSIRQILYFEHYDRYISCIVIFYTNNLTCQITYNDKILLGTIAGYQDYYTIDRLKFDRGTLNVFFSYYDETTDGDTTMDKKIFSSNIENICPLHIIKSLIRLLHKNISTLVIVRCILISICGYSKLLIRLIDSVLENFLK